MFKYSAFTENTPEMREWLEKLGYEDQMIKGNSILYACKGKAFTTNTNYPSFKLMQKESILDCLTNPELFKAIAAIRDDSDYKQWFYSDYWEEKEWWLSDRYAVKYIDRMVGNRREWHRAAKEELIKHFKTDRT